MSPTVVRVTEESYSLGEGPHWDIATQCLYFVDCIQLNIVRYDPKTNKVTKASTAPKRPSFIIPVEGEKNKFIVSLTRELSIISWDGESDKFDLIETLCVVDNVPEKSSNTFNDGKCDSSGRLWAGTMLLDIKDVNICPPVGTLYSLDSKRQPKAHVDQIQLTNGIAFNDHEKKMFYIDSLKGTVDQFDLNLADGTISNRQVFFTLKKNNVPGIPDGMTIDTNGNLWVAIFGGGRVIKIDGQNPETLLDTIILPAMQTTSVAFGGRYLEELYVTSACFEQKGVKPSLPENGATYRVSGIGAKGVPANNFRLN